ncbi:glycosyltransferase family 4 protein [Bacillus sp. S14(2024)]|uniref:glycosyltransferase family 4 protein n=1 Tax=Bacillus sp. S14(2024) TaxID=3162884 RepID=UPI003D1AAACC
MSKKVLFCATVDYHFKAFHLPYMKWFQDKGWEVHVAARGDIELPFVDEKYNIPIKRSPFHMNNVNAYKELKKIIEKHNYEIIHCHTPMGGVLARLAARKARKKGTKVIYTVHGFHFFKGAPFINWLVYYPIEQSLSRYTDCLITINEEDYQLALKKFNQNICIKKIHGVGVDLEKFKTVNDQEKMKLRKKYGFRMEDFILIYPAELNLNKNQKVLLESIVLLKNHIPNIRLLLPGEGSMEEEYKKFLKDNYIEENVFLYGFCEHIHELIQLSDLSVSSSLREGLGMNLVEGMACGKPVIAMDNRGHRELIKQGTNGFIFHKGDELVERVLEIYTSSVKREEMGKMGIYISKIYSQTNTLKEMDEIYGMYMRLTSPSLSTNAFKSRKL